MSPPAKEKARSYLMKVCLFHPTQKTIGKVETKIRATLMREAAAAGNLDKYLRSKAGAYIKGPKDVLFLVDGHHVASSLLTIDKKYIGDDPEFYVTQLDDWSNQTDLAAFWKKMESAGFAFPYDEQDNRINPQDIPRDLTGLVDDPYRTLAWLLRKDEQFENTNEPFQEFKIGRFLRRHIKIVGSTAVDFAVAMVQARGLLHLEIAATLPGFLPFPKLFDCRFVSVKVERLLNYIK